jgi:hypothetical protein
MLNYKQFYTTLTVIAALRLGIQQVHLRVPCVLLPHTSGPPIRPGHPECLLRGILRTSCAVGPFDNPDVRISLSPHWMVVLGCNGCLGW